MNIVSCIPTIYVPHLLFWFLFRGGWSDFIALDRNLEIFFGWFIQRSWKISLIKENCQVTSQILVESHRLASIFFLVSCNFWLGSGYFVFLKKIKLGQVGCQACQTGLSDWGRVLTFFHLYNWHQLDRVWSDSVRLI